VNSKRSPREVRDKGVQMAYVDRNSRKIQYRLLMFLLDLYILIRREDKADLIETIDEITQTHT
jgi:hypothetical protein